VSDALWERIAEVLAEPAQVMGRPRYAPRACLEGILYVLATDTPWADVPFRELGLPSGETCRRRLEQWQQRGVLEAVFLLLRAQLDNAGQLDYRRVLIDASMVEAKKGARRSRARSAARTAPAFI
jgi:transposase